MDNIIFISLPVEEFLEKLVDKIEARNIKTQPETIPNPSLDDRLYGDRAAANHIGCTVQTVIALRKRGEIPFYKYGRKYYYKASEIDKSLKVDARRFGELRRRRGI